MNVYLKYREQATELIEPHVFKHNQFRCLCLKTAAELLGPEYYEIMMADKIRNLGPKPGTIYPWNVVDYLSMRLQFEDQENVS